MEFDLNRINLYRPFFSIGTWGTRTPRVGHGLLQKVRSETWNPKGSASALSEKRMRKGGTKNLQNLRSYLLLSSSQAHTQPAMATISCSSPSSLFFNLVRTSTHSTTPPPSLSFPSFHFPRSVSLSHTYSSKPTKASRLVVNAVTEEEVGLVSEGGGEGIAQDPSEDTVSVPISPSDVLVMYFKVPPFLNFTNFLFLLLLFFGFCLIWFVVLCRQKEQWTITQFLKLEKD